MPSRSPGICFGAQALAVALGGSARRLEAPEHAWIELASSRPELIPPGPWLALHDDAIAPPPRARELARNESGVQAFTVGHHLGVQFHPEATESLIARWVADKRDALSRVREALLAGARDRGHVTAAAATQLFGAFVARAGLEQRFAA